jgi:hypothetical protein
VTPRDWLSTWISSAVAIATRKSVDRHDVVDRDRQDPDAEDQRQGRTETRSRRDAEREGARERIVQDRLHLRAGDRQRRPGDDRHQRDRQADVPDHDAQRGRHTRRIEQGIDDLHGAVARGAEHEIDDEAGEKQAKQPGQDQAPAEAQRAIGETRLRFLCSNGRAHLRVHLRSTVTQ